MIYMTKRITYEEFERRFKLSRSIYKNGTVVYVGCFETYKEKLKFKIDSAEDLDYYDDFAYRELLKMVLKKVNKYV